MLFILSGPSCVGKSFVTNYLTQHYQLNTLVPFTTRLPRLSESEGIHYHFRSVDELKRISNSFRNGYWAQPLGRDWYGYSTEIDQIFETDGHHWIIQAYSEIAKAIKEKNPSSQLVFLDFESEAIMRQKIKDRFPEGPELAKRLDHAKHEISSSKDFDITIKEDSVLRILTKVRIYIEQSIGYLPPRMDSAGPLNDYQLIELIRSNRSGFRLDSPLPKEPDSDVSGWTIDLTLSPRFFFPKRTFRPRFLQRVFDLAQADTEKVGRIFVEHTAQPEKGFRLLAGEFILASTNEKLTLPANMAGLITGRSSYSRMGLSVELSQNILQPGHNDVVALQIKNNLPFDIRIYPGTRIAQVAMFRLTGPSKFPYETKKKPKYLGSNNDLRSRFFDDEFYESVRGKKIPKAGLDVAIDIAQIVLGLASILFAMATWVVPSSLFSLSFAAIAIVTTSLFVALLVYKIFRVKR